MLAKLVLKHHRKMLMGVSQKSFHSSAPLNEVVSTFLAPLTMISDDRERIDPKGHD